MARRLTKRPRPRPRTNKSHIPVPYTHSFLGLPHLGRFHVPLLHQGVFRGLRSEREGPRQEAHQVVHLRHGRGRGRGRGGTETKAKTAIQKRGRTRIER